MTNDTRTADDIERDIREERAQMSDSINSLQQKFSVDAIVTDIGSMVRAQGGDIGQAVTRTIGRNPAAVALVGVGLAWLFLGQNRGSDDPSQRRTGPTIRSGNEGSHDPDQHWYRSNRMTPGHSTQSSGGDRSGDMAGGMHSAAHSMRSAVSEAATDFGTATADLTERLSHGLDDLSEEARARVVAARHAAHEARLASGAALQKGAQAASGFFEEQPLVVGALAVALGAAIGGALPHSKLEDDTMGDSSDRLFAEAQHMLYAERDKAMAMARTAAADVKDEIREAGSELAGLVPEGKSVGEVIVDRAAGAASRVYGHAMGDEPATDGPADQAADKPAS